MRRIAAPTYDPVVVFDTCVAAIPNVSVRQAYAANQPHMNQAALDFTAATATTSWVNLPRVPRGNPDAVIAGTLTKKHLMDLYSEYMVGAAGAPRRIYDDLLVTPGGHCPFCGGLGQVHTLDHYLPQSPSEKS